MDRQQFEQLVQAAFQEIPLKFKKLITNVAIIIEDRPDPSLSPHLKTNHLLLGFYHGVPLQKRGSFYGNVPPDVIYIFQEPIERICRTPEEIKLKVKEVLLHELGHYFGLTESQLREIEINKGEKS
ncbi:MAG TPA: metallopeptidase family protein [Candidatus Aminicenantes bacterium]|nr:metallopeptidase family protein [Candidatus Aminicenantes bacterium]